MATTVRDVDRNRRLGNLLPSAAMVDTMPARLLEPRADAAPEGSDAVAVVLRVEAHAEGERFSEPPLLRG